MKEVDQIKLQLGSELRNLRIEKGLTKKEVCSSIDLSAKELARIESGQVSPTFVNAVRLINFCGGSLNDIAQTLSMRCSEVDLSYDFSDNHKKRLAQYINETYYCYFIFTQTAVKRMGFDTMKIRTNSDIEEGYLGATAEHNDYQYDVKIISPMEYDYTFFYLTSKGTLKDKAILIFPFIREIKRKFTAGVGVMLSFSIDSPTVPCFQKVMLLSDRVYGSVRSDVVQQSGLDLLKLQQDNRTERSKYIVTDSNLLSQTKEFHNRCQQKLRSKQN